MSDLFQDGWQKEDMEAAIKRNIPAELLYVPIWITMDPPDWPDGAWAEKICVQLSSHENFNVRGNAMLGFGHLARTCRQLTLEFVTPILLGGLNDESDYVRNQVNTAIDDIEWFLSCQIRPA